MGLEAYRVAQGPNGVFRLAEVQQGHASAAMGSREVGFQRHGAAVTGQCVGVTSNGVQRVGEVDLQERVVGFDGRRGRERLHSLGRAAHSRERGTEELQGIAIAWLGCKELSIGFDGFRESSLLVERVGARERLVAAGHCGYSTCTAPAVPPNIFSRDSRAVSNLRKVMLFGALLGGYAWAAGPTGTGLDNCPKIAGDKERLACFDREFASLAQRKPAVAGAPGATTAPGANTPANESSRPAAPAKSVAASTPAPAELTPEQAIGLPPGK